MKKICIRNWLAALCLLAAGLCYGIGCARRADPGFEFVPGEGEGAPGEMASPAGGEGVPGEMAVPAGGGAEAEPGRSAAGTAGGTEAGAGGAAEAGGPADGAGEPAGGGETAPAEIYVYICGEVAVPGVYRLKEGERLYRAVELAGGFTERAARDSLNLARKASDGMKIVVLSEEEWSVAESAGREAFLESAGRDAMAEAAGAYRPEEGPGGEGALKGASGQGPAGAAGGGDGPPAGGDPAGKVNLNTADRAELMTLAGIGAVRADEILRYRQEHGPFRAIEDVMKVTGIKEAVYAKIKDKITVD